MVQSHAGAAGLKKPGSDGDGGAPALSALGVLMPIDFDLVCNPTPKCPHCKGDFGEVTDLEDEVADIICPHCEKVYHYDSYVERTFNTRKTGDE